MQKVDFSMIFDTKFLRRKVIALIVACARLSDSIVGTY